MPQTITKEVTLYTYKELVEANSNGEMKRAYEKAREWMVEGATDGDWWFESVVDMWKRCLEQFGFIDPTIYFSGFWSQGDGACFECKHVDTHKLIDILSRTDITGSDSVEFDGVKEDFIPWAWKKVGGWTVSPKFRLLKLDCFDLSASITSRGSGNYSHSTSREIAVDSNPYHKHHPRCAELCVEFEAVAERLRQDLSDAIYKSLEEEYDYRTSDEALIEDAEANEWTFNDEGEREDV